MRFSLARVTDPDIEPITLAQMKRHLREFDGVTSSDGDITNLIVGAREWIENFTGRALIDQTWRLSIDQRGGLQGDIVGGFSGRGPFIGRYGYYAGAFRWHGQSEIMLRKSPVLDITSFVTVDATGAETAIDTSNYQLRDANSKWPRIVPLAGANWGTSSLRITFRAGFSDRLGSPQQDAGAVPELFKQAMKLWVEAMYDRDPVMMPLLLKTAEALIKPERAETSTA